MERRSLKRWAKRFRVRYWRHGEEEEPRLGHTLNISTRGMYIGTGKPLKSGTRVRVEIVDPEDGFVVEGVVAHSHEVAPELHRIKQPGMGVRLLGVQELIEGLIGERSQRAPAAESTAAPEGTRSAATYRVRFRDRAHFFDVFRRDVIRGGMYVPTRDPARLDQLVALEIVPPTRTAESFEIPARVVQRMEPSGTRSEQGLGRYSGMGVEFIDPDRALDLYEQVVKRLGG